MKRTIYILVIVTLLWGAVPCVLGTQADTAPSQEYKIKAAFVYNFIKFVDWPKTKIAEANDVITIGIIGKDPFGKAFEPILKKNIKEKKLLIKQFPSLSSFGDDSNDHQYEKRYRDKYEKLLEKCHVLFICSSEQRYFEPIINMVNDSAVLTVGETEGLLELGGIIKFTMEQKKVRFEINAGAARKCKLKVRSQLLRLARKVIDDKKSGDAAK